MCIVNNQHERYLINNLEKMKAKFDDLNYKWNIERNKIEAKAQNAKVEVKKKFEEQLKTLQKRRDPTLIRCLQDSGNRQIAKPKTTQPPISQFQK